MALTFEEKKIIVAEVHEIAKTALSLVVADARGVDVSSMTLLRKQAREDKVILRVVKNNLAKLAIDGTDYQCVSKNLSKPSLFGFSMEDPGAAARLFKDFAVEQPEFEIKLLSIGGQLLESNQLDILAKLPTYEQALASLCSVMLAPIGKLVRITNEIPTKVVRVFDQVAKSKAV